MDDDTKNQGTTAQKEQTPKQQVIESLKNANNVLVTISNNPTVDQLSACIGLTLMMNKLGKHATAVFSGAIPSTIDFLEPAQTIEQNTDSLRDFIISLDKSKADKLRYKVEDDVVRIYITPYKTSISDADLEFTQGDFNVDVVVALGIYNKDQLDGAIIEHGQILHDAVVMDISCGPNAAEMGSINWYEPQASSLSEMLVSISESFKTGLLDEQMATAFLTGIVAETDRFSNDRTTPKVMTISAQLMAAGANQQLIANQLTLPPEPQPELEQATESVAAPVNPGELSIDHEEDPVPEQVTNEVEQGSPEGGLAFSLREESKSEPAPEDHSTVNPNDAAAILGTSDSDVTNLESSSDNSSQPTKEDPSRIDIDEHGKIVDLDAAEQEQTYTHKKVIQPLNMPPPVQKTDLSKVNLDDPAFANGPINTAPSPTPDMIPTGNVGPLEAALAAAAPASSMPNPAAPVPVAGEQTLEDLERAVDSPHIANLPSAERQAMAEAGYVPEPPSSLPQFPLPDEVQNQDTPTNQLPPDLPPPFVPPSNNQPTNNNELNLPAPQ